MATTPTLFPLKFRRQQAEPIDEDSVFDTTAARTSYLTNPRRYAGQVVSDTEDGKFYGLNLARDAWIELGAGGGGGTALWAEQRVTESTPVAIPVSPFLVDSFTPNSDYIDGHVPETGNPAVVWHEDDDYGYINYQNYVISLDSSAFSAFAFNYYGAGGSNDYGYPQTLSVSFVFKNDAYAQPGLEYHGVLLRLTTGGVDFEFQISRPNAGVWSVTNGSTTVSAVDTVVAGTDYTATILIENGNQVFTVLGTTVTESVAFADSNTFNKMELEVGYSSYFGSLSIEDAAAVVTYVDGIVVDEIVPDPSTPAAVDPNYDRVDAVVLEDHELTIEANPIVKVMGNVETRPRDSVNSFGITKTGALNIVPNAFPQPATLLGTVVDKAGDLRISSSYIYYCFSDYTDGSSNIWVRLPFSLAASVNKWAQWPINCSVVAFYNSAPLSDNDVPLNDYTGIATTGVIPGLGTMLAGSGFYGANYSFTPDTPGFTILYLISYNLSVLGPTSANGTFDVRGGTADDYTSTVLYRSRFSVAQLYSSPTITTVSFTYVHTNSANPFYLDMNVAVGGDLSWAFTGDLTITELSRTAN